jgi:hypothetical protein
VPEIVDSTARIHILHRKTADIAKASSYFIISARRAWNVARECSPTVLLLPNIHGPVWAYRHGIARGHRSNARYVQDLPVDYRAFESVVALTDDINLAVI